MLVRELVHPSLTIVAHNLQHIDSQTVVPRIFEQGSDCVFDAHDLVTEGVHAQLVGKCQRLSKILVRFAYVEPFAAAVEEGFAELLCDGLGEVVVWLDDDVLVVPRDVEDADARYEGDAADA